MHFVVVKITGEALKNWREKRDLNLEQVGELLGGVTGPTVSRWENGQEIPGPAQLLLNMLIHGEMPFPGVGPEGSEDSERQHFWKLRLTLEDWHQLEALSVQAGFGCVRDYLLALIQDHLKSPPDTSTAPLPIKPGISCLKETPPDGEMKVAEG